MVSVPYIIISITSIYTLIPAVPPNVNGNNGFVVKAQKVIIHNPVHRIRHLPR